MDTTKLEQLERRVANLERELALLQNKPVTAQQIEPITAAPPAAVPATATPELTASAESTPPVVSARPQAPPKPPTDPIDWEHLIARVWLPRIFIVVFLIGVLWGFTAAVNAGFITEPVRCLIGVVVAALMYWQAERQSARKRQALGQVLHGGAIAVLILSLSAAHLMYDLIPAAPSFILYILAIGIGLYTAFRHRSQVLIIIMMTAGYLIPFLVDSQDPNIRVLVAYEAIFSIVMLLLSDRFRYRVAMYGAYLLLHLPLLMTYAFSETEERLIFFLAIVLQHMVLLALFSFRAYWKEGHRAVILFTSFGLLAAWCGGLYSDHVYLYTLTLSVSALVYGLLTFALYRRERSYGVHLSIATLAVFLLLIDLLDVGQLSAAMIVQGTIAIILGHALKSFLQQFTGFSILSIGALLTIGWPIEEVWSEPTFAWLVLLAAILALYSWIRRLPDDSNYKQLKSALLWIDAALLLIFATQITSVATEALGEDLRRLILSAVWLIYAIAFILVGVAAQQRKARLAGVLFLLITLLKVIFVDLPDVSTAVRAVLFLALGGIGVAVSRLFYKSDKKTEQE